MLAAAEAGAFDVLLVGYTARYMRDLALALSYRRWFHRQGVVVYICDDRILSSNPADWERFVDKCKAAEINSREQSRNVRAGYAAKRDTHRDPGGHPPFGFRRSGEARVVEIDPERIGTAVRAYALAAAGLTDREVAGRLGLGLHTIRGILTSPLYRGRLRDGSAANWDPVVDEETWRRVADLRAARNRRSPGRPETRRTYALPMLECAACGRRLVGDKDRYRHLEACAAFMAARPRAARSAGATRASRARATGATSTRRSCRSCSNGSAWARATSRPLRVRIAGELGQSPTSCAWPGSRRSANARSRRTGAIGIPWSSSRRCASSTPPRPRLRAVRSGRALPPDEVRRYLENLPAWWADADPDDRRALATTLFERIRVLGVSVAKLEPTQEALDHGLAEAFGPDEVEMVGARGVATTISIGPAQDLSGSAIKGAAG